MTQSYTALERRAEALKTFLDTEVVNPLVSDKGVAEYRAQKSDLIKDFGMIPVMLYDAQFAGYTDLNTPEKRTKYYQNWEEMKKAYAGLLHNPEVFDPKNMVLVQGNPLNYKQWNDLAEGQLNPLTEPQKKALYAAGLYMQQNSIAKDRYPLHTAIQAPNSKYAAVGDCNVLTTIYANFLLEAKDEKGNNIFQPQDIRIEQHPNHTRLDVKGVRYETTSHFVLTPKHEAWDEKGNLNALNSLLGINIIEKTVGQNIDKNNADLQISRAKQAYIYFPVDTVKNILTDSYSAKYNQYMKQTQTAISQQDAFEVYRISKEADTYVEKNQLEKVLSVPHAGKLVKGLKEIIFTDDDIKKFEDRIKAGNADSKTSFAPSSGDTLPEKAKTDAVAAALNLKDNIITGAEIPTAPFVPFNKGPSSRYV